MQLCDASRNRGAMAKNKTKSGNPNKHLQVRLAYLQRAAAYLSTGKLAIVDSDGAVSTGTRPTEDTDGVSGQSEVVTGPHNATSGMTGGLPKHLLHHLTQVARKSQIRLLPSVKHSICKRCTNLLVDGRTSSKSVENSSKGGKKSQANVLAVTCSYCGTAKRFPMGVARQKKKAQREAVKKTVKLDHQSG